MRGVGVSGWQLAGRSGIPPGPWCSLLSVSVLCDLQSSALPHPPSAAMSLLRVARVAVQRSAPLLQQRAAVAAQPARLMSDNASPATPIEDLRGRQLEEAVDLAGVAGFNDLPALGPFGTIAAPVRIYSSFHSRYVGCKGGDDLKHRLLWFELKQGPKHVCTEVRHSHEPRI